MPEGLNPDLTNYLKSMESNVDKGYKLKNSKGNDIPVRISGNKLQQYTNGSWQDIIGTETVTETVTVNTVTSSSGGSSSSSSSGSDSDYYGQRLYTEMAEYMEEQGFAKTDYVDTQDALKQNILTAGTGISIVNDTISSTIDGLPTVTSSDNGKILKVVNGAWTLVMDSGGGDEVNATDWIETTYSPDTPGNWSLIDGVPTHSYSQTATNASLFRVGTITVFNDYNVFRPMPTAVETTTLFISETYNSNANYRFDYGTTSGADGIDLGVSVPQDWDLESSDIIEMVITIGLDNNYSDITFNAKYRFFRSVQ